MKEYRSYLSLTVAFILVVFLYGCGPGVRITEGNLNFLKNEKVINVKYEYDGMRVGKLTEDEYTKNRTKELNEKQSGRGDEWLKSWKSDRTTMFQPKFEDLVNKHLEGKLVVKPNADEAKYTMTVKTVYTEPGWNAFVMKQPALINVIIVFTETNNPKIVLASLEIDKSTGSTYGFSDMDTGIRIAEAYAKCGKTLGSRLAKIL
jgi:hypothetical protein